jgi:Holliday junction resolvasome RuvABC endonuclease subunit
MPRLPKNQRILAIDPGIRHVGIAVLQGPDLMYHGVLTMPYRRSPKAVRRNTRVLVRHLLDDFHPTVLALEENSIGSNRTRSLLHAVVSETRRVGRREGIEVVSNTASTVKKSPTDSGRASKENVARACARCYPQLKAYLRQTTKWRTQYHGNMFDAVALGLTVGPATGWLHKKSPIADLPRPHRNDLTHEARGEDPG